MKLSIRSSTPAFKMLNSWRNPFDGNENMSVFDQVRIKVLYYVSTCGRNKIDGMTRRGKGLSIPGGAPDQ